MIDKNSILEEIKNNYNILTAHLDYMEELQVHCINAIGQDYTQSEQELQFENEAVDNLFKSIKEAREKGITVTEIMNSIDNDPYYILPRKYKKNVKQTNS